MSHQNEPLEIINIPTHIMNIFNYIDKKHKGSLKSNFSKDCHLMAEHILTQAGIKNPSSFLDEKDTNHIFDFFISSQIHRYKNKSYLDSVNFKNLDLVTNFTADFSKLTYPNNPRSKILFLFLMKQPAISPESFLNCVRPFLESKTELKIPEVDIYLIMLWALSHEFEPTFLNQQIEEKVEFLKLLNRTTSDFKEFFYLSISNYLLSIGDSQHLYQQRV